MCHYPLYFEVDAHRGDDKCGVEVAKYDLPTLTITYNKFKAILHANNKLICGDHDTTCYKMTPSLPSLMHNGKDPSELLFSSGPDGRGKV